MQETQLDEEKAVQELRDVQEEITFRLQCEKFRFYEPNAKCEEFIKKVGELNEAGKHNFIVLFSAANGVGKTCVSANIIAHILWGKESENPWFDYPLFKNFPFPKKGRIVSDPENIKTNLIPTMKEWFPEGRYKPMKGGKQYDSVWTTDSGFEFDIMSYEQDPKEFESATLGWAWFDEPPPEAIFKATVSRMRKGGIIIISETPLYGAWLYDHFIANPDQETLAKGQRAYIEAGVEAACKQHGVRGHLEHDDIERMIAEYTEDEKQARVNGKFQHLIGMRFKQFSRNIHVIPPFNIDRRNYSVWHALDTHPRVNDCGVWIAMDRKGRKIVVDEFWEKCANGTEGMAETIKSKNSNYRIEKLLLEPSAFVKDQHLDQNEEVLADKLQKYGLNYFPATKNRTASDKCIEDALTYTKIPLNGVEEYIKAPELYIFSNCVHTIWEFEHLMWAQRTGKSADTKEKPGVAVDKDDHAIECVGRILIQKPQFVPMPERSSGPSHEKNYDPYS